MVALMLFHRHLKKLCSGDLENMFDKVGGGKGKVIQILLVRWKIGKQLQFLCSCHHYILVTSPSMWLKSLENCVHDTISFCWLLHWTESIIIPNGVQVWSELLNFCFTDHLLCKHPRWLFTRGTTCAYNQDRGWQW